MKWPFALAMLICTVYAPPLRAQSSTPTPGTVETGQGWQRITDPNALGYSRTALDSALAIARGMNTSALLVAVGGRSLLEYGDLADTSYVASARKSVLSMLYGRYVENGTIRLNETLAEIGIDDLGGLLPLERTATVEHLLGARSGVYHAASNPGDALAMAPPRGSQKPGTYNLYSNWDFNALGTIFEKKTGRGIYDAFESDIARPIGMQDFHRSVHKRAGDTTKSVHMAYHFVLSTRDMARLGHLMLRNGKWGEQQVIPAAWVRRSTRMVTPPAEINPPGLRAMALGNGFGYSFLWWNRVRPDTTDVFHGAYAAEGAFGQYILVVPKLDMVVAHKVVARGGMTANQSVTLQQFETLVRAIASARCQSVAVRTTPPPNTGGRIAPCHFAVPPFTQHWGLAASVPKGQTSPAPAPSPAVSSASDSNTVARLKTFVGKYELAPDRALVVTLEGSSLVADAAGEKATLFPESDMKFAVGAPDRLMKVIFMRDTNESVSALTIVMPNGTERTARRIP